MSDDLFQRPGRFSVTRYMLYEHPRELIAQVFAKVLVVRAECMFSTDAIEYTAYGPDFDLCERFLIPPLYQAIFTRHEDGLITLYWSRQP